jgi:hypothetical protein
MVETLDLKIVKADSLVIFGGGWVKIPAIKLLQRNRE